MPMLRLGTVVGTLACLLLGCSGPTALEPEVVEAQKSVYEQLQQLEADVGLDSEGNIVEVTFSDEKFGDDKLQILSGLSSLKQLNLAGTGITDAGLEQLESFSGLKTLEIEDTKVTARGVKKLKAALSGCGINSSFDDEGG